MVSSFFASTGFATCAVVLAIGCSAGNADNPRRGGGTGGVVAASGAPNAAGGAATGGGDGVGGIAGASGSSTGAAGGDTSGTAGTMGGGGTPNGAGGTPACASSTAWDITYNLDGSTFEIRDTPGGVGNQINTCTPPYTANNQIGPGTMVLRFANSGGAPGPGRVHVMGFDMDLEFTVPGATSVHSALVEKSVSGACGAASGIFDGTTVKWDAPGMNLLTSGILTCTGTLCTLGGLPNGTPQIQDYNGHQALVDFVFSNGVSKITMSEVLVMRDSTSSEWLTIQGAETGRSPVCDCQ